MHDDANANRFEFKPAGTELFTRPIERSYRWAVEYSAKEYVDLLGTYSDHISLPESKRSDLFSAITDLIDREYGGRVIKQYETVLKLQRKK